MDARLRVELDNSGEPLDVGTVISHGLQRLFLEKLGMDIKPRLQNKIGVGYQYDETNSAHIILTTPPTPPTERIDLEASLERDRDESITREHTLVFEALSDWLEESR